MALRETQHASEVYATGGDTMRETQHASEVYATGGDSMLITQHAIEVYATEDAITAVSRGRAYFLGL